MQKWSGNENLDVKMDGQPIQLSDLVVKWMSGQYMKKEILICIASFITWCKPNWDEIFSTALPSVVVMSFLHQVLDFASQLPRSNKY